MQSGLIRGVTQVDPKGCGIAVVATVTGRSYEQVRKRALLTGDWRASYGMNGAMLKRLLDRLGWPVLRVTMRREHSKLAVVKVSGRVRCVVWRNGKPEQRRRLWQHWVVWHQGTVWDPGYGVLWNGNGLLDGMELYLASIKTHDVKVTHVKTGRWHWV